METGPQDALLGRAMAALRRGDIKAARAGFESLPRPPWMLLAKACNDCGDMPGLEHALSRQLAIEPRNLAALLGMGELKARQGDERSATSFFQAAIAHVAGRPVPPGIAAQVERARVFVNGAAARFEQQLLGRLDHAALLQGDSHRRFRHAIDLLLGKVPVYQQQPTKFYFPELPQRTFYEREEFAWLAPMEAAAGAMTQELRQVMDRGVAFPPYVEGDADRPAQDTHLRGNADWGAFHFWKDGQVVHPNADLCPATMAALAHAPMPDIAGRSPMALWSLLKPGTHIPPHHGMLNTHLICHIPLIVPGACALRVGHETRPWRAGETLVFDDSIEHEAWNRSNETRVILLFEIWRPEITPEERSALAQLFAAIDDFGQAS